MMTPLALVLKPKWFIKHIYFYISNATTASIPIETGSIMVAYVAKTKTSLNLRPEQILLV